MSRVAEYHKSAKERFDQVQALFATIDKDQAGEAKPEQIEQIKTWNKEAEEFVKSARDAEAFDAQRQAAQKGLDYLGGVGQGFQYGGKTERQVEQTVKNIADRFLEAPEWQGYMKSICANGSIPERMRVNSPPVNFNEGVKALITGLSSTSAGALVINERKPIIDPGTFYRPLAIRDLVTVAQTNSDTVEYVRQGAHTNAAAAVAEATATSGSSGAKPESSMVLAIVTETVKTIATWLPATRRALADAGQLRGLIEQLLRYDLAEELEDQIIAGSGSGENFTGVLNVSGTTAQAWDTDMLTTLRKARTKVSLTGRGTPTAYVLHPTDVETLDLLTDNEERYYFGGPQGVGVPRLWGLPIVESEAMTVGYGVVAPWNLAVLWDREQTSIMASDSHSDFFIRNLIAILGELRAAFGLIRPAAFVIADLTA